MKQVDKQILTLNKKQMLKLRDNYIHRDNARQMTKVSENRKDFFNLLAVYVGKDDKNPLKYTRGTFTTKSTPVFLFVVKMHEMHPELFKDIL